MLPPANMILRGEPMPVVSAGEGVEGGAPPATVLIVYCCADAAIIDGVHQDAALFEPGADIGGREAGGRDVKDDDVGIDLGGIDQHPGDLGEPLGENARVGVIDGELRGGFFERDESRGGEHTGLPHATAETLAVEARFGHEIGGTGEDGADRRTESFG